MEYLDDLKELPGNFMKCGIVPGGDVYLCRISAGQGLAAYGKNLSSDVSYLWLRRLSFACAEAD